MRNLTGHGTAVRVVWQPDGEGVEVAPGYAMDDDGCAGEHAYGARYCLEAVPAASLTVWFYAAYSSADRGGGFIIGRHYEHVVYDGDEEPWRWSTYDVADDRGWYPSLLIAEHGARRVAEAFAASPFTGDPESSDGGFDWDGTPW